MPDLTSAAIGEWADFMPDTISINAFVSRGSSGITYSATTNTYPAYIELKNHLVIDSQGREVMARGTVYVGTASMIGIEDLLTLPSRYVPQQPPIIAVRPVSDESGVHHIEMEIG